MLSWNHNLKRIVNESPSRRKKLSDPTLINWETITDVLFLSGTDKYQLSDLQRILPRIFKIKFMLTASYWSNWMQVFITTGRPRGFNDWITLEVQTHYFCRAHCKFMKWLGHDYNYDLPWKFFLFYLLMFLVFRNINRAGTALK